MTDALVYQNVRQAIVSRAIERLYRQTYPDCRAGARSRGVSRCGHEIERGARNRLHYYWHECGWRYRSIHLIIRERQFDGCTEHPTHRLYTVTAGGHCNAIFPERAIADMSRAAKTTYYLT